jgi:hypothetical protein
MDIVDRLIQGSIDMHVHHSPDANIERSVDAFQAVAGAEAAGMRGIVLKSHDYPTTPLAIIAGKQYKNVAVIGSLCLDFAVGGLNLSALEASAALGAKVVWMPTFSAEHDMKKRGLGPGGISILDERGNILPVVVNILKIIKQCDIVVASGHISYGETAVLVTEARKQGIEKIVITHALEPRFGATLSIEQQKQMVALGAYIEHTYLSTLPKGGNIGLKALIDAVKDLGAGHCILSTDLGQKENPLPAEGMRAAIAALLSLGLSEADLTMMLKTNPARLLGLS